MSEEDTQKIKLEDGDVVDQETKEIIDELKDENPEADTPPEEDKEEEKESEEETEEDKADEAEESEEESEEEDEPDKAEVEPKPVRPVKAVPVKKYQDEKRKWKEQNSNLKLEIEKLQQAKPDQSETEKELDLGELAEEYGVDKEFVNKLASKISAKAQLPDTDKAKLDFLTAKYETEKADTEFDSAVGKLQEDYPDEPIADYKDKIKKLGYTEGYTELSTYELYFRLVKPEIPTKKKTAEKTKSSGEVSKEVLDYDNVSETDIDNMSDTEFDEYTEHQASKEKKFNIQ